MLEAIAALGIVALCAAVVVAGNRAFTKFDHNRDFSNAEIIEIESNRRSLDIPYELKFAYFIELCRYSKNGSIRVPSWSNLGETEAEKARSLMLVRENNIKLVIEETGEVITPETKVPAMR